MFHELTKLILFSCVLLSLNGCSEPIKTSIDNKNSINLCKNLHKVVDIDDLLKQMYDNIDSDCLFNIPTNELEKIWKIKIFDYDYNKIKTYNDGQKIFQEINQFSNKQQSLYIMRTLNIDKSTIKNKDDEFIIYSTNRYGSYSIFEGSFTEEKFPYHLPKPKIKELIFFDNQPKGSDNELSDYNPTMEYYWSNSTIENPKPKLIINVSDGVKGFNIIFSRNVKPST